jgi:hypothetical protein
MYVCIYAGALDAVREMESDGLNVLFVTAPLKGPLGRSCVQDKMKWVETHLGPAWLDRVIFCQDKVRALMLPLFLPHPYSDLISPSDVVRRPPCAGTSSSTTSRSSSWMPRRTIWPPLGR